MKTAMLSSIWSCRQMRHTMRTGQDAQAELAGTISGSHSAMQPKAISKLLFQTLCVFQLLGTLTDNAQDQSPAKN